MYADSAGDAEQRDLRGVVPELPAAAKQQPAEVDAPAPSAKLTPVQACCEHVIADVEKDWPTGTTTWVQTNWGKLPTAQWKSRHFAQHHAVAADGAKKKLGLSEAEFGEACAILKDETTEAAQRYTAAMQVKLEDLAERERESEAGAIAAATTGVPSWRDLPGGVTVKVTKFEEGEEQKRGNKFLRKLSLEGAGAAEISPRAVVVQDVDAGNKQTMMAMAEAVSIRTSTRGLMSFL